MTSDAAWRPLVWDAAREDDWQEALTCARQPGVRVCDTLPEQLFDLAAAREPARRWTPADRTTAVERLAMGQPLERFGCYVFYPWTRTLVHLLPAAAFHELRTDRNRLKILPDEQRHLRAMRIGIAGLSVGLAVATTLALEGIGGAFHLADFDTLSLSNLNRLLAPLSELGLNKAIIAARRVFEIDPYLDIRIFPEGITETSLPGFFGDDLGRIDLLVEECDDLYMKILLREHARRRHVPVVMETSDRGMLDVERFDREPHRPVLHGLLDGVDAAGLTGLSTRDKVPIVLRILGADHLSPRTAASLVEVRQTVSSWPQLASSVMLGGATVADAARRIRLKTFSESGRYYVDLGGLVGDGRAHALETPEPPRASTPGLPPRPPAVMALADLEGMPITDDEVRWIVAHGVRAPSGGNVQPWRFVWHRPTLECHLDEDRSRSVLNVRHLGSLTAIGAAIENMLLAASARGFVPEVSIPPGASWSMPVCTLRFGSRGAAAHPPLLAAVWARTTNRKGGNGQPLSGDARAELAAAAAPGSIRWFDTPADLEALGHLQGRAERLRFLLEPMHRELMHEIRWSADEAARSGDGLDVQTLELTPSDLAALRIVSTWSTVEWLSRVDGGRALGESAVTTFRSASAVARLTMDGEGPSSYLDGGRALERLWLAATRHGLGVHPQGALVYFVTRWELGDREVFDGCAVEMEAIHREYRSLAPRDGRAEILLLRLAYTPPPSARSARRPVEAVLSIASPS